MIVNNIEDYYFIVNPASDTGRLKKKWKKFLPKLQEFADTNNFTFDWVFTEHRLDGMNKAEFAMDHGYKQVVAAGGDGVANEVGNFIIKNGKSIKLGLLPMGTSNDLHNSLRLPKDPEECLKLLTNGYTEKLEVGKATGDFSDEPHYFLNHSDCGLSSMAALSARDGSKILKGEFKYTYHAVKKLLRFKRNPAEIEIDGEKLKHDLTVMGVAFGEMMGGYKLWPDNKMRQGDFSIVYAYGQSRLKLLKLLIAAEKGNHIGKDGVVLTRGKKVSIYLENEWPFEAEGELYTEKSKEVHFEYVPDAIEYFTVKPE